MPLKMAPVWELEWEEREALVGVGETQRKQFIPQEPRGHLAWQGQQEVEPPQKLHWPIVEDKKEKVRAPGLKPWPAGVT